MACYVIKTKGPCKKEYALWQKLGYTGSFDKYCEAKLSVGEVDMIITGDLGPHCADCAGVGDFLCDYPVGEGKTCDRPMCDGHAHEISTEIHYCDTHYKEWRAFVENGGVAKELSNVIAFNGEKK